MIKPAITVGSFVWYGTRAGYPASRYSYDKPSAHLLARGKLFYLKRLTVVDVQVMLTSATRCPGEHPIHIRQLLLQARPLRIRIHGFQYHLGFALVTQHPRSGQQDDASGGHHPERNEIRH